ncbi:MAG: glutamate synthase large subunit [Gemmataceae bacterium]|nr:glutamate synthase large subunit [Gemmataceae bacterium]MCI0740109.1 glutamate synthase large subunit [Gemmataceae bacterium]
MNIEPQRQGLYDPRYEHDACGVGFLADLKNRKSHQIVRDALQILLSLEHRGACGCEANTGDGAGILVQMPHRFLQKECDRLDFALPNAGDYGCGIVFLPQDPQDRQRCMSAFERVVRDEGQNFLGWRDVPTDNTPIGPTARKVEPVMKQIFIGNSRPHAPRGGSPHAERGGSAGSPHAERGANTLAFERKLYVIRKLVESEIKHSNIPQREMFYVPSLSLKTLVYKGMLHAPQVPVYFPDLRDPTLESALALVHSRFSTNTFPNWARAHPYRYLAHNGEINTLRGNVNWMHARESMLASDLFGDDIKKILPIIDEAGSDSAMFDNVLEMLVLTGRVLPHAVMMMIPEPWSGDDFMSPEKKAFYEFHSALMEPWDGPASIAFTDGIRIGAVLDRNGLRPSRYYVTKDERVIMASEVGVLDVPPENVLHKGRLQPGRMFLVDLELGRIIADDELKYKIASEKPYAEWIEENLVSLEDLPEVPAPHEPDHETVLLRQQAFGYTHEDLRTLMAPMANDGNEAVGSMGNDAALAVLSDKPQLLYNYFKQLFAQVTNPPVDCIREEIIMSMETTIGREYNLLHPTPQSCRQIRLKSPILLNHELDKLRQLEATTRGRFKSVTLPILYHPKEGAAGLERGLKALCRQATIAIATGVEYIILSDRAVDKNHAPIPALLAVAAVHHHLIREGTRTQVSLVLESGEPREVHHFALLIGYGAGAINPYLAFETIEDMVRLGHITKVDAKKAVKNYVKSIDKGVLKVMSKMGISTAQSYCGAQIFEAVGLGQDVIDEYFTGTPSRVGGIGVDVIATEIRSRHDKAFAERPTNGHTLDVGGHYQYRREGEYHLFNPESVHKLQHACRTGNFKIFQQYTELVNDQSKRLCTLRGLMEFKLDGRQPVPIEEVEPIEAIMKRFKSGAMSYGSISQEAHETLAIAMNRIGGKSNTGEGGEDPARYIPLANGDSKNSAIKQVASGRFGVTSEYLVYAKELQIKMAQGAKPGEGGQLPGHKVYPWIARVRLSTPGVGLISPPPHHDIYSIEDLAELIHDLKNANRRARISVKLVAEVGVGTIAAGVSKAHSDVVLISGHDGGTGASPLTSIKHAGIPWELGLAETQQTLVLNDLRSRIVVEVDGQLKTGRDVIVGALLGAEEFGFATAPLVALGCIMMRVCHLNTCPVGVATQDPRLRKKFTGDPDHVVNFMKFIATEVRELMAKLGFRKFEDMVGRSELLQMTKAIGHYKALGLDFSNIFHQPDVPKSVGKFCSKPQEHGLEKSLDVTKLLDLCQPAIEHGQPVRATLPIRNIHRVVGAITGSELTRKHGAKGLPEDTIQLYFHGSAGQSFGAFVPPGMTLTLEGDANDYLGKGLSGGKIIVFPPAAATFVPEENVIIGNVAFYGATSGTAYVRGLAGERFCVRNSGVHAVVEAVGDHGCEYMTGGRVVVLGPTGRNFAAGMSGGIAYVLDDKGEFPKRCNLEMVKLFKLEDDAEIEDVRAMIKKHAEYTKSDRAWKVLALWEEMLPKFVKVYPNDYRRVIETQKRFKEGGLSDEEAIMAAFEENAHDVARVGGK